MARKVFFSFHYARDAWRVAQVRNCNVVKSNYEVNPFYDKAEWESIKRTTPGGIKSWIDRQLSGASVTVVLIGAETAKRQWVKYEIQQSIAQGKALIGIHISHLKIPGGLTDPVGMNPLPPQYPTYRWSHDLGAYNLGKWIEDAAIRQRRR